MGEMADWTNEQIEEALLHNELFYEDEREDEPYHDLLCKFCGKPCYWVLLKDNWILFDYWNGIHICSGMFGNG